MTSRVLSIARNTFREAVRDRVLYSLIVFALLMIGASLLFGQISLGIERIVLVNLGLTAISIFGVVIGIFIGIGLVSKEIERKTLYAVLSRPVRRWEFIAGKFLGLVATLVVNATFMAAGFFAALFIVDRHFSGSDLPLLAALYFILLQFVIATAIALLFSSFSSPLLSTILSFALFVAGTFSSDLRLMVHSARGLPKVLVAIAAYVVPNMAALNVISSVAHEQAVPGKLVLYNTAYALFYGIALLAASTLIFERRNLK